MSKVAVCYLPEDSRDVAARLCDLLAEELGASRVVQGVDLLDQTSALDVVMVIIGQGWLMAIDAEGRRRLDDPSDAVRVQIERSLATGAMVVPVLLGQVQMPRHDQLPSGLAQLSYQNGARLRPDPDFHKDVARLLRAIRNHSSSRKFLLGQSDLIAALAHGLNGAIAGAIFALACGLLCFAVRPRFPVITTLVVAILFATWPLGWFFVWRRTGRAREALMACLILSSVPVVIEFLSLVMGAGLSVLSFVLMSQFGLPTEVAVFGARWTLQNLWFSFNGGMIGAVLGAAIMACSST